MATTYEPIATTTLTGTSATITFSSIPGTYTDLRLVFVGTQSGAGVSRMRFNSDTGTNYSITYLNGDGATAASARQTNQTGIEITASAALSTSVPTMKAIDIFSYAGSTNKTALVVESGDLNGSGYTGVIAGLWRSTSAITTIDIAKAASTYAAGTTVTLYGILKA